MPEYDLVQYGAMNADRVRFAAYERVRSFGGRRYEVDYAKVLPVTYFVFLALTAFGLLAIFRDIIDPVNI